MNCNDVQELLPLYVGRDLEERRAKLVTAHLQSCVECAGSVDEYRETRQLLQQFAPPQFSEAVYAGIRQRVLRQIEQEATAPDLSRLFASLLRPRLRWAVAAALLLAVSVFAFYFIATRKADPMPNLSNDRKQLADSRGKVAGPPSTAPKETEQVLPAPVKKVRPAPGLAAGTYRSQQRKGTDTARDRTRPATVISADKASITAGAAPDSNNLAEPDFFPALEPSASEKPLRVEMQTRDPNIRIIWFTPQPAKHDSPNKFSKGI